MNKRELHVNIEDAIADKRRDEFHELIEEFKAHEQCTYDDLCDSAGCRWDAERKVFKCGKVKR